MKLPDKTGDAVDISNERFETVADFALKLKAVIALNSDFSCSVLDSRSNSPTTLSFLSLSVDVCILSPSDMFP